MAPLLPPVEGRVENLLFRFVSVPPASQPAPTKPQKECIPIPSPGLQRIERDVSGQSDALPPSPLSPVGVLRSSSSPLRRPDHQQPLRSLRPQLRRPDDRFPQRAQVSVTHTHTVDAYAVTADAPAVPPVPPRCPAAGTPVVPLIPLVRPLGAWLQLPSPSRWVLRTIRLGYEIQFNRHTPKFAGIRFTTVKASVAHVLLAEVEVLLAKDAIEPIPLTEMRSGFYSPYFIVPKKGGGLRPILDLRVLNKSLQKRSFRMITPKQIFSAIRPQDWFAAIDLKDAYFHVSILPRHRPFLRFAFEGRAYQYKVLPFGLSLSPRVFTKVVEAALKPLRESGVRILAYLDDWLIIAHSRRTLCEHRDLTLQHLARLGLRVNWEKSKLCPTQRISFLGMELDSIDLSARLTEERVQSILTCLGSFRGKNAVPLKQFQRLLGRMAAAAAVTPLGLLHMRPLQRWLHDRVPRRAWRAGIHRVTITPACRLTFPPWSDPAFLRAGVSMRQVSRHAFVHTDASDTGWGATYDELTASGVWTAPQLHWHINCRELWAVYLGLVRFATELRGKDVLVRSDNTATVAYINRQGGLRSRHLSHLARHLLLWSQKHLRSLRAIYIPGSLNTAADALSRAARPGEWRLHPQTVQLIWRKFGRAQIDLFASPDNTHCRLFYSLTEGSLGVDALAHSWPRGMRKYAFPPVSLSDLPQAVSNTIDAARAPSTRRAYALKWNLFVTWCSSQREDPRECPINIVLLYLQHRLDGRLSPSTIKVDIAAISAHHSLINGRSVGQHDLVIRFLRGARRLNPSRPPSIPPWDLSMVLKALQSPPFEPLQSASLKLLSMKALTLLALASVKRIGDLHAFSVDDSCLQFGPSVSSVTLRPRPGYVPKVPTTPFRDQVVSLQALPLEQANPTEALLCPVRALRFYVDRTQSFRTSDQLFVCYGGQQKGKAVTKQRMSHWIVDTIALAYNLQGIPCPFNLRAHSTRSVASSWALARGSSLTDICRAAGWATPNTFIRFYNVRIEPVSSRVLSSPGRTRRADSQVGLQPPTEAPN
nr:uncharacterized protein LOC129434990 [Misgurnus anguillicaudatus]